LRCYFCNINGILVESGPINRPPILPRARKRTREPHRGGNGPFGLSNGLPCSFKQTNNQRRLRLLHPYLMCQPPKMVVSEFEVLGGRQSLTRRFRDMMVEPRIKSLAYEGESMARNPDWISISALVISAGTAVFSTYQWFTNQREISVNSAVDISTKYMTDPQINLLRSHYYQAKKHTDDQSKQELPTLISYVRYIEFVTRLINTDKIDVHYVSPELLCDIQFESESKKPVIDQFAIDTDEFSKFKKRFAQFFRNDCDREDQ
jgi:hypothetical protein